MTLPWMAMPRDAEDAPSNVAPPGLPSPPSTGLTIQDASRVLGVPAPTIRAWERRYGLAHTARSAGGHRRYTSDALHQLRLMRDEIARGRRAAEAAEVVLALTAPAARSPDLVSRFLASSQRMDPAGVRAALDEAQRELGLGGAVDDVLMPALRQVGEWWETGRCDIAQEHLTTEAVRGWLSALSAFAPDPTRPDALVLACGPRDMHSVGLEALSVLMAYDGWRCRVLGGRTPADSLVAAIRGTGASAAVVVSHLSIGRRPAVEAIRGAAALGVHVFYAGNAFLSPRSRTSTPGTYLGESLQAAAATIRHTLEASAGS